MSHKKTPMTPAAAARIQRAVAKQQGGTVVSNSVAARAQRAAANNNTAQQVQTNELNRSKQLNPNNNEYWKSHGFNQRPKDWEQRIEQGKTKP
ncbi:hypothetical protein [Ferrimonas senticii]|uniref:hypothetical protein n=1 Tax=Ferrimonas senticii TaxID=394566 RepID=UPI0003FD1E59|nr:hypothetical protein [Ferrimonas senticii]